MGSSFTEARPLARNRAYLSWYNPNISLPILCFAHLSTTFYIQRPQSLYLFPELAGLCYDSSMDKYLKTGGQEATDRVNQECIDEENARLNPLLMRKAGQLSLEDIMAYDPQSF